MTNRICNTFRDLFHGYGLGGLTLGRVLLAWSLWLGVGAWAWLVYEWCCDRTGRTCARLGEDKVWPKARYPSRNVTCRDFNGYTIRTWATWDNEQEWWASITKGDIVEDESPEVQGPFADPHKALFHCIVKIVDQCGKDG